MLQDSRDRSVHRAELQNNLATALAKITERLDQIERNSHRDRHLHQEPHQTNRDIDDQDSSDSEGAAATDEESVTACATANRRWSKLQRQLPTTERASGHYAAISMPAALFETEWRRRLRILPSHADHIPDVVEQCILSLTTAHRAATLAKNSEDQMLRYATHKCLSIAIFAAARLQLRMANVTSDAYAHFAAECKKATAKNRRGKTAYVSNDTIVTQITASKKHIRVATDRGYGRNRGRGRGGRGGGRGNRGPLSVDSESPESVTSRESVKPYRGRR